MDKQGHTIDLLLTEERDEQAAKRCLTQAIRWHGGPEKITIDGRAANEAAINSDNTEHGTSSMIRRVKYFNNSVEPDQRGSKRVPGPMWGFQTFEAAQGPLAGIALLHRIKKQ